MHFSSINVSQLIKSPSFGTMAQQVTLTVMQALGPAFPLWNPRQAEESDRRLISTLALWHAHLHTIIIE